ncbi:MFS transporter [Aquisediminimonas sediminicola]|uniref:MFS transporter n=1 Tax=Alteraquisediminimonas sediminicola TaxID=2676787 RepID=UPI001C8E2DD5|nr:MFS transporter [Aquisediminimonas sediminicola]
MHSSLRLLTRRRFLPLFATQLLGAFNDNLFKSAMVMLVVYRIYSDPATEMAFSALAGAIFILPYLVLSASAGQLADFRDKARLIRIIKTAEIIIMIGGAVGLLFGNLPLLLLALFAMGVHSTFFGPIKYAILPQHLESDEVLGGTGLVEAGTYIAILGGTIFGGLMQGAVNSGDLPHWSVGAAVIAVAVVGRWIGGMVPPAHPEVPNLPVDHHPIRQSIRLVSATMHIPRLFLAIWAISFFWAMGAILAAQFPPLVKNEFHGDENVATMFLSIFSIGVAIGSVAVNRLLSGHVSARYSPISAIVMGLFVLDLYWSVSHWPISNGALLTVGEFIRLGHADRVLLDLFGVAVAGGMFVVPLYAFLTTTVPKSETARTVAANNIVNSGAMVLSALLLAVLMKIGVSIGGTLLMVSAASLIAAYLAQRLHRACD